MSYPIGTTLKRKVPFPPEGAQAGLNHLQVVAVSPTSRPNVGEWAGAAAGDILVCTPVEMFGDNEEIPVAALNRDYEVDYMPPLEEPVQVQAQQPNTRRTREENPEEAFARMAEEKRQAEIEAAAMLAKAKPKAKA